MEQEARDSIESQGSHLMRKMFTKPTNTQAVTMSERRKQAKSSEKQTGSASLTADDASPSGVDASKPDRTLDVCELVASLKNEVNEHFRATNANIDRLSNQLSASVQIMLELTQARPRPPSAPLGARHPPAIRANGRSDMEIVSNAAGKVRMTPRENSHDEFGATKMVSSLKPELTDNSSPPDPALAVTDVDANPCEDSMQRHHSPVSEHTQITSEADGTHLSHQSSRSNSEDRPSRFHKSMHYTKVQFSRVINRVRDRSAISRKVWLYLEDPDLVYGGRQFLHLMTLWSLGACLVTILQTYEDPPLRASTAEWFEVSWDATSSLELLTRFFVCPNRLAFFFSTFNWIDLVAGPLPLLLRAILQLPSLQEGPYTKDVNIFLTCFVPALRLLRMIRHFESLHLLFKAFQQAGEVIPFLLFTLAIKVVVFSSIIFMVEPRSNIASLPSAIWFTIVTVGTVGYGDMVPETLAGTVIVMGLIVMSALYMAMPIGLIGRAFGDVWENRDLLLLAQRARRRFLSNGFKPEDVPAMFMSFDLDGNGQLSLNEFCAMMDSLQIDISGGRVVRLFQSFDADGGGTIDDAEFVRLLFPAAYAEIYKHEHPLECEITGRHSLESSTKPPLKLEL